jgi:predicted GNAT family acetyltransferase
VSLDSVGLGRRVVEPSTPSDEHLGTQGVARDVTELVLLQEFTRKAELILPVCSVCHKIRTGVGEGAEWLPLEEYVERKTGVQYSHTYCPEHVPSG